MIVQRLERHHHLGGRAVRRGDDPLRMERRLGIDLGDHQRDPLLHPPVAGLVDDGGPRLDRRRQVLGRGLVRRGGEHQVDPLEGAGGQFLDDVVLSLEGQRRAGAAGRGEKAEVPGLKVPFFQQLPHDAAHSPCRAHQGHGLKHGSDPLFRSAGKAFLINYSERRMPAAITCRTARRRGVSACRTPLSPERAAGTRPAPTRTVRNRFADSLSSRPS